MLNNQPTRRSFFGYLATVVFSCFAAKKLAELALTPKAQGASTPSLVSGAGPLDFSTCSVRTCSYDSVGRLTLITESRGQTMTYTYDREGICKPSPGRF